MSTRGEAVVLTAGSVVLPFVMWNVMLHVPSDAGHAGWLVSTRPVYVSTPTAVPVASFTPLLISGTGFKLMLNEYCRGCSQVSGPGVVVAVAVLVF